MESHTSTQAGVQRDNLGSLQPLPPEFKQFLASWVAEITAMCPYAQLIFVFSVEMGFHHVAQAGLELLTSGDLPTSASQSARISGVSHHDWPETVFLDVHNWLNISIQTVCKEFL